MDTLRVPRTQLHRRVGIFAYSDLLEGMGVHGPTRQLWVVAKFIERELSQTEPQSVLGGAEIDPKWVAEKLGGVVKAVGANRKVLPSGTVPELALGAQRYVAWDIYRDFAELLNLRCGPVAYPNVGQRLRRQGFEVSVDDLHEVAQDFLDSYLPRSLRSYRLELGTDREEHWLSSVFYRFALRAVLTDRAHRQHLSVDLIQEDSSTALEDQEREGLMALVPQILETLPARERIALERYFGFGAKPQTLAEISEVLRCSAHLARAAVVQGLAAVASQLELQGVLNSREIELSRRMFGEGMPLGTAAQELRLSPKEARAVAQGISLKLRGGLRSRTVSVRALLVPGKKDEETHMASGLSEEEILSAVERLEKTPRLDTDAMGFVYAYVAGYRVSLGRIREALWAAGSLPRLESKGIPLDWLAQPDPTFTRADVDPADVEWKAQLRAMGKRSWQVAEALYDEVIERLRDKRSALPEPKDQGMIIERIYRVLMASARTLEGTLSRELRRSSGPRLRADWQKDGRTIGRWEDDQRDLSFDLKEEVVWPSVEEFSELPESVAGVLPDLMIDGLRLGHVHLPRFHRLEESTGDTVWWRWTEPILRRDT